MVGLKRLTILGYAVICIAQTWTDKVGAAMMDQTRDKMYRTNMDRQGRCSYDGPNKR
jgi:hypothetical protein